MVFNSLTFFLFFNAFYLLFWITNNRAPLKARNAFILAGSYLFYGCWDWRFLSLIVISSLADYLIGLGIFQAEKLQTKRILLGISLLVNLGILGFFKYYNFFIESFISLLSVFQFSPGVHTLNIILPVGISFYTFQTLSYTIDIYRGNTRPTRDAVSFFAFVAFFPQLVAGPIERAKHLLGQFNEKKSFNYANTVSGLRLVLWGLFKKMVIADNFGLMVDMIFSPEHSPSSVMVVLGIFLFAFQIYCDFSGYSDMAIGLSRMLGFDLMKNFQTPYFSASFTEFWRRWHISLSTWFRDYVYIPLGGNQRSAAGTRVNLLITFLLSGLWHGANITFLIWGSLHGLLLILEKPFRWKPPRPLAVLGVFLTVCLLWLPFRAENFEHLSQLLNALFQFSGPSAAELGFFGSITKMLSLIGVFLTFLGLESAFGLRSFEEWVEPQPRWIRFALYYFLLLAILVLGNFDVKPYFIYFQF